MTAATGRSLISVVVPCYNESEVIGIFYRALRPVLESLADVDHEIVFVDDGSSDDTLAQLNTIAQGDPGVRVCSLSRNFGHQITLTAGLDFAEGDAVIMMDSDLQHPPSLIPALVARWREGADIVSAVRQRTEGESWFKGATSRGFYTLLNALSGTKVPPGAADFCLITARVRQALIDMPERHRFLRGMISWVGFRRVLVPYEAPPRAAGKTKYSLVKMVGLALDAVFSFSAEPLRLALRNVVQLRQCVVGAAVVHEDNLMVKIGQRFQHGAKRPVEDADDLGLVVARHHNREQAPARHGAHRGYAHRGYRSLSRATWMVLSSL